jgi:hypothetical protein
VRNCCNKFSSVTRRALIIPSNLKIKKTSLEKRIELIDCMTRQTKFTDKVMSFTPTQQGPSESCDVGKFGGLAFEQSTGVLMRTVRWTPTNIVMTKYVGERPYAAALVAQRQQVHTVASSVGRIKFVSGVGVALLSGWISGNGHTRYFIFSSHGYVVLMFVCFVDLLITLQLSR